jgi:O-acetyl-ADP-ribose deacetylase (regulator of RNase III)
MILYVKGNLFYSPAQVLVNTVNTTGVMGRGVAQEFKRLFPDMFQQYRDLCERDQFRIGQLWLYRSPQKWVLNFPTKQHWRAPSRIEYIEAGLEKFVQVYSEWGIHSIAFPTLGCGNGQLDFADQVRPLMEEYLKSLPIDVFIYIYSKKESAFVEHLDIQTMKKWLRSEPTSLPFSEVWDDLVEILAHKQDFETIAQKNPFRVQVLQEPPVLRVMASGNQTYIIHYETLLAFWQQLRTHGFSMRHIAPGLDRELSYVIPIFAELPYVTPVHVAEGYKALNTTSLTSLQILPPALNRQVSTQPQQLSLFSVG